MVEVFLSPDPLPHDPINSIEDALAYNLALGEYRAATTLKALLQALAEEFNQIQVKSS